MARVMNIPIKKINNGAKLGFTSNKSASGGEGDHLIFGTSKEKLWQVCSPAGWQRIGPRLAIALRDLIY